MDADARGTKNRRRKPGGTLGSYLNLSNQPLPSDKEKLLRSGPKFCLPSRLPPVNLLSLSRKVAAYVPEESKGTCVGECVSVVSRFGLQSSRTGNTGVLVDFLAASGLTAVVSDKEGFIVIMEKGTFFEKGASAVDKNFHRVRDEQTKGVVWRRS
ncbi:hypothetical protein HPB52_024308 [Rhipicephalus sanguineus]|uniref:Uncharacterized protein n=1 Tax=Rhipicephalus sanguineus TaxID=34632 RepID=A0A9D4TCK7_RHISA|nr:hypothetical protein HPB52_024308 [Rhipicephalus sanguineus]